MYGGPGDKDMLIEVYQPHCSCHLPNSILKCMRSEFMHTTYSYLYK